MDGADTKQHAAGLVRSPAAGLAAREPAEHPPASPQGWYAVGFAADLKPRGIMTRRFFGRDIIVARTKSGRAYAAEAACPHLGAHLGHGGTVAGDAVRCPFHGLKFDLRAGHCTYSPFGTPPRAARLGRVDLREVHGVLMAWHDPTGADPSWEIDQPEPGPRWRRLSTRTMRFSSHPQEVTENSVDIAHFAVLHGFRDVEELQPLTADGPRLRARYRFKRPTLGLSVPTEIHIRVDGLGWSLVELTAAGWLMRQLVLTTPTGPREVDVHVATSLHRRGATLPSRAVWAPIEALTQRLVLRTVTAELRADQHVWDHKYYLARPAIADGDGPIPAYRRWTRQFYTTDRGGAL